MTNNKVDFEKYFKGKKITLMGLGGLGRGVIEAEFLIKHGADLIITDLQNEKQLKQEITVIKKAIKKYKKNNATVSFTLGKQKIADFKNRDIVFSANGVSLDNKYILSAKKYSKIVTKSIAYVFWIIQNEKLDIKTIGVTGTKGKSTTTALIEHMLQINDTKVFSGGNLRAAANLPILEKISTGDVLLAELDSWLLQGFGNLKISPQYAVFTNFFNDHQNYYHSMKKYFKDKSYLFMFQKKTDFLILTNQSSKNIKTYFSKKILSKKIISKTSLLPKWNYPIFGEHNQKNISQAIELGKVLGISQKNIRKSMETFISIEGRFEYLGQEKGVLFYNDNNSTTPDSTAISLKALSKKYSKSKIYLLAGGADKEFDFKILSKAIEKYVTKTVLFTGTGTNKIVYLFKKRFDKYQIVDSMKKAFFESVKEAKKEDIVVLSPGAASLGMFKNEYDRNDQFIEEYKQWTKK
jgi:UDP-N-acetylmuramoylalanine--D-glutamate ligase